MLALHRKRKRRSTDSVTCIAQSPEEELEEVVDFLWKHFLKENSDRTHPHQMVLATYSIVRATLNSEEVNQECVSRYLPHPVLSLSLSIHHPCHKLASFTFYLLSKTDTHIEYGFTVPGT